MLCCASTFNKNVSVCWENKDKKFAFDAVFPPGSNNKQVFENTTKDLVETVFNGYNCSVFAYGATGAGKTFTMLGGKVREEGLVIATPNTVGCLGLSWHHIPHDGGNI